MDTLETLEIEVLASDECWNRKALMATRYSELQFIENYITLKVQAPQRIVDEEFHRQSYVYEHSREVCPGKELLS